MSFPQKLPLSTTSCIWSRSNTTKSSSEIAVTCSCCHPHWHCPYPSITRSHWNIQQPPTWSYYFLFCPHLIHFHWLLLASYFAISFFGHCAQLYSLQMLLPCWIIPLLFTFHSALIMDVSALKLSLKCSSHVFYIR